MVKATSVPNAAANIMVNGLLNIIAAAARTAAIKRADGAFRPTIKSPQIMPAIVPVRPARSLVKPRPPSQMKSPARTAAIPDAIKNMGLNRSAAF